jgi:hypothetical protein
MAVAIFLTMQVAGYLDASWLEWFDGLEMRHLQDGKTELFGIVVDQAALHGVLNQARDIGLTILSVTAETTGVADEEAKD